MADMADLQKIIANLGSELAKDPASMCFVQLADAYRQAGQMDDALEVALRGTWMHPGYAPGHVAVGRIYLQRQVLGKAAESFQRAIEADPANCDAYKGMARLKREQGDLDAAASIVKKALQLFPEDNMLKQMQASLPAVGNPDVISEKTVTAPSGQAASISGSRAMKPITTATIAEIYMEQGLYAQALQVYRELLVSTPDDVVLKKKIADLEKLLRGEVPDSMQPQYASAPLDDIIEPVETVTTGGSTSALETLEGWLAAIQARRNSV